MANARWFQAKQHAAWAFGRELRDRLLTEYCQTYSLRVPPPPATIIDELLADVVGVRLRYRSLPPDRFAQTNLDGDTVVVTVNDDIAKIRGVKDALGVGNVAKWHEMIHVVRDLDALRRPATLALPGFGVAQEIVCYRAADKGKLASRDESVEREFWAEEAGRAAAVSLDALKRSQPFSELLAAARRTTGSVRAGWPLLYDAAREIGVNISALVKQLQLEGVIVLVRHDGRDEVAVQPGFLTGGAPWQ